MPGSTQKCMLFSMRNWYTCLFLGMSAGSVPVECLFSVTGLVCNGRRSSLCPSKLNKICFLHDNLSYIMSVDWGHSSEHCSDSGDGITVKSYYTNTVTALRTYRFLPVHVFAVVGLFAMHIVICQWLCCLVPDWWLSVIVQLYIVSVNLPTCDRGLK